MHARAFLCMYFGEFHDKRRATVDELSSCMGEVQGLAPLVAKWRAERSIDLECRARLGRREETGHSTGNFARYALVVHVGSELIPV